jgi:hypothetical protein
LYRIRLASPLCSWLAIARWAGWRKRNEGESAPMTLGQALAAKVRLIAWCKACGHRAETGERIDQIQGFASI